MRVVCLGAHILDVLGRPVPDLPPGQGRHVLDEIRVTAAGTAAGTAVDLAKLGATVASIGAIGDDSSGRLLRALLEENGVDASRLAVRAGQATPSTMLPIRPNGERPALHAPGAMGALVSGDVDADFVSGADVLHVGAPECLGPFGRDDLPGIVTRARARGATITMDLLRSTPDMLQVFEPLFPFVDYFFPNDDQIRTLTGLTDLVEAAGAVIALGVRSVVVTCGAEGLLIVSGDGVVRVPAFEVDVVDTTGCGDAVVAGFLVGLDQGWSITDAAQLGAAAAAQVAQGLGSDAGIVDLPTTVAFWSECVGHSVPPVPVA